jgi:hypothetical protein
MMKQTSLLRYVGPDTAKGSSQAARQRAEGQEAEERQKAQEREEGKKQA